MADRTQAGTTLIEALVVLALVGIIVAAATMSFRTLESPVDTATSLLEGFLRQARLNAIASTSAYRVSPASPSRLEVASASSCTATTWSVDPSLELTLPQGVTMSPGSWQVCFSSRGVSSSNLVVTLQHPSNGSRKVEVLVGGTTRVLP